MSILLYIIWNLVVSVEHTPYLDWASPIQPDMYVSMTWIRSKWLRFWRELICTKCNRNSFLALSDSPGGCSTYYSMRNLRTRLWVLFFELLTHTVCVWTRTALKMYTYFNVYSHFGFLAIGCDGMLNRGQRTPYILYSTVYCSLYSERNYSTSTCTNHDFRTHKHKWST